MKSDLVYLDLLLRVCLGAYGSWVKSGSDRWDDNDLMTLMNMFVDYVPVHSVDAYKSMTILSRPIDPFSESHLLELSVFPTLVLRTQKPWISVKRH